MSSNSPKESKGKKPSIDASLPPPSASRPMAASAPQFRSVALSQFPQDQIMRSPHVGTLKRPDHIGRPGIEEVIDKSSYFNPSEKKAPALKAAGKAASNWFPTKLRPVPAFYPVEKSSRLVEGDLKEIAARLSDCLRVLSVHAVYNNDTATASLTTPENVEMHLSLWKVSGNAGILVELQRRKGDSITFHRYSQYILDAAVEVLDIEKFERMHGGDIDFMHYKKVERLLQMESKAPATEHENAVIAIEIAHSLLMKDRMDARQLGLESLCLLTDPRKTGTTTAVIASHVVLLGSASGLAVSTGEEALMLDEAPFQEIREAILSLVQFSRIGDDEVGEDSGKVDDFEERDFGEGEHMSLLHNLALAVLANALDVVENEERLSDEPEETEKKPAARSKSDIANSFMNRTLETSKVDILSTLIQELSKAEKNPHNAHLSARSLGSLCKASKEAKLKARKQGYKSIVSTAIEVGERTHLKLLTECKKVEEILNSNEN